MSSSTVTKEMKVEIERAKRDKHGRDQRFDAKLPMEIRARYKLY